MFLMATFRFRSSSVSPSIGFEPAGPFHEHAPAAGVHHHLRDRRIAQQMFERADERKNAIETAHKMPRAT